MWLLMNYEGCIEMLSWPFKISFLYVPCYSLAVVFHSFFVFYFQKKKTRLELFSISNENYAQIHIRDANVKWILFFTLFSNFVFPWNWLRQLCAVDTIMFSHPFTSLMVMSDVIWFRTFDSINYTLNTHCVEWMTKRNCLSAIFMVCILDIFGICVNRKCPQMKFYSSRMSIFLSII